MNTDLTNAEIEYAELLLDEGYGPDFITHAIVMARQVGVHNDILAAVDMIIEEREKDE